MANISQVQINGAAYDVNDKNSVKFTSQSLTSAQKIQAEDNIGLPFGVTDYTDTELIPTTTVNMTAEYDSDNNLRWYISDAITGNNSFNGSTIDNNYFYILTIDGVSYKAHGDCHSSTEAKTNGWRDCKAIGDVSVLEFHQIYEAENEVEDYVLAYRFKDNYLLNLYTNDTSATHIISLVQRVYTSRKIDQTISDIDSILVRKGDDGESVLLGAAEESSGDGSIAEGIATKALGPADHAEGGITIASGGVCHAEGIGTKATQTCCHAEGAYTTASNYYSHVQGYHTTASGVTSHAEGHSTVASGQGSHAEGAATTASGGYSHTGGAYSTAAGRGGFSHGLYTSSTQPCQFVVGYGNDPQTDSIFEIGNGLNSSNTANNTGNDAPTTRQNAFRVTQDGTAIAQTAIGIQTSSGVVSLSAGQINALSSIETFSSSNIDTVWDLAGTLNRVGGEIFYIDTTASGATYTFYDENYNELTDVEVGDTPYYYTVTGTPSKDMYYVYYDSAYTNKYWTYKDSSGNWVYNSLGTTDAIGSGKTNTNIVMAADSGAYADYADTIWNTLKTMRTNAINGCTDWFVPSLAELQELDDYYGLSILFPNTSIWTSYEDPDNNQDAYFYFYRYGIWNTSGKYGLVDLVAIRSF